MQRPWNYISSLVALVFVSIWAENSALAYQLMAGAAMVDVSPTKLPVIVNGGFLAAEANAIDDPLFAKALVLGDGSKKIAIVVVDSCMLPRELIDLTKQQIFQAIDIPTDQICISATHTHSAPSSMGALGTPPDPDYVNMLPAKIAQAVLLASKGMVPARVGYTSVDDYAHTHCRVWIRRPDKIEIDPFGERTIRANMHPGYLNPDVLAPAGPVDPGLTLLSVQAVKENKPIALFANYSMHYYGASPVSADYFGRFARKITQMIGAGPEFVAMMSQGTSGDQMWMDYGKSKADPGIDAYADEIAKVAFEAYQSIKDYQSRPVIKMTEGEIQARRRTPDTKRLLWARLVADNMGRENPKNQKEVYAREAIILSEQDPVRTLKLQVIRIGEFGIVAIPNEVYAISGLRIKAHSPLKTTCVVELANGSEGYIPPPEQHALGGYTTWPARTAGLEAQTEPRVVNAVVGLLERASGRSFNRLTERHGPYAESVLASRPLAYWRLGELTGSTALDSTPNHSSALLEPGFALGLNGPDSPIFCGEGVINRCVHLAGGRIKADSQPIASMYTIEFWFWNALPTNIRPIVGDLFSLGREGEPDERLRLVAEDGVAHFELLGGLPNRPTARSKNEIPPKTWNHLALVRNGKSIRLYLNGKEKPEFDTQMPSLGDELHRELYIGGTRLGENNFEGKIDEISFYRRALNFSEIQAHYTAVQP